MKDTQVPNTISNQAQKKNIKILAKENHENTVQNHCINKSYNTKNLTNQ